jgi:hypothetical protein
MNAMDIAIIPPGALARQFCEGRTCQMALAGELEHGMIQTDYKEFYNQSWKIRSVHWLLDNGAWETESLDPEALLRIAHKYAATEIMAPDVLYDPSATLDKTLEFIKVLREYHPEWSSRVLPKPRIAAIAHGSSIRESMYFIAQIHQQAPEVKTIAISRTTTYRSGNPTARLELALEIKRQYQNEYQVHLLGFSDKWPTEIQHCNSFPGLVRSLDTIAPFSYAYNGFSMETVGTVDVPRPNNYFSLTPTDFNPALVEHNIATLDKWARTAIHGVRAA